MATQKRMARKLSQQKEGGLEVAAPTEDSIDFSQGRIMLGRLIRSTAVGAAIGSIYGTGAGLVKRKGFKGSLTEARSFAKTFAILFGVQSYVSQSMKRMRGKDDAINAGVAGCIAGIAVMGPGSSLLRSCVPFGTFSFIVGLRKDPDILVRLSRSLKESQNTLQQISFSVLPPYTLPSPDPKREAVASKLSSEFEAEASKLFSVVSKRLYDYARSARQGKASGDTNM